MIQPNWILLNFRFFFCVPTALHHEIARDKRIQQRVQQTQRRMESPRNEWCKQIEWQRQQLFAQPTNGC